MKSRSRSLLAGLTLPEMAAILLLVAAVTVVAVPQFISGQVTTNEESAVGFLREIAVAQEGFLRQSGNATFGFIGELMGVGQGRPRHAGLPPVLRLPSDTFDQGILTHHGYHFIVYLVDERGRPLARPESTPKAPLKPYWIAYAWPAQYGTSGRKVFAIDPRGSVWAYQNSIQPLSGLTGSPPAHLLAARIPENEYPFTAPPKALLQLHWERVPGP